MNLGLGLNMPIQPIFIEVPVGDYNNDFNNDFN